MASFALTFGAFGDLVVLAQAFGTITKALSDARGSPQEIRELVDQCNAFQRTLESILDAVTTINSVRLAGLRVGFDVPNLGVDLNVTLDLDLTATNPNHASFRYGDGSADLYYRGNVVGEAAIPPGEVAAGGSVRTEVLLTVMAGRLIGNSAVYADAISGSLPFTTTTEIPGRVTVLGVFKHHMVTYSTCNIVVNVRNRSVENSDCTYKTKL